MGEVIKTCESSLGGGLEIENSTKITAYGYGNVKNRFINTEGIGGDFVKINTESTYGSPFDMGNGFALAIQSDLVTTSSTTKRNINLIVINLENGTTTETYSLTTTFGMYPYYYGTNAYDIAKIGEDRYIIAIPVATASSSAHYIGVFDITYTEGNMILNKFSSDDSHRAFVQAMMIYTTPINGIYFISTLCDRATASSTSQSPQLFSYNPDTMTIIYLGKSGYGHCYNYFIYNDKVYHLFETGSTTFYPNLISKTITNTPTEKSGIVIGENVQLPSMSTIFSNYYISTFNYARISERNDIVFIIGLGFLGSTYQTAKWNITILPIYLTNNTFGAALSILTEESIPNSSREDIQIGCTVMEDVFYIHGKTTKPIAYKYDLLNDAWNEIENNYKLTNTNLNFPIGCPMSYNSRHYGSCANVDSDYSMYTAFNRGYMFKVASADYAVELTESTNINGIAVSAATPLNKGDILLRKDN